MVFRVLQIAIPFVWFGAVGAISFMEAPLKFTAPNITIPLGLGIGMIVFHTLNKIEIDRDSARRNPAQAILAARP